MKKISACIAALMITACANLGPSLQTATYTPPDVSQTGRYSQSIDKSFDDTWTSVIDFVSTSSFSIDNFEKDSGLITLTFGASDPGRYIKCGFFTTSGGNVGSFSGKYVEYINGVGNIGSSLSGKMNISIRSLSENKTNVRVNARYIWTVGGQSQSTFSFDTGNSSTIRISNQTSGTIPTRTCLPTYYAESSVIDFVKSI
jgi:hypothetical protein